jgi:hypothetical protein
MATNQRNETEFGRQAMLLAEQLGRIAGTIEGTAEAWMSRQSVTEQLTRIRDAASEMLESLMNGAAQGRRAVTGTTRSMAAQVGRAADTATSTVASAATSAIDTTASAVRAVPSTVRSAGRAISGRATRRSATKKTGARASTRKAATADPARAPGKQHRKPPQKGARGRKSDVKIANMKVAEANRRRRPSHV